MVACLWHEDSKASMQFNIEKGLFVCFGCGAAGGMKKLERHLGIRVIEDQIDIQSIREKLAALKREPRADLPVLDESHLLRYKFPNRYWKGRGFDDSTIKAFDLGIDPMGDFASIPIRNVNGELLGIIKRFLAKDADLKYKYPKGFKRQLNLFGSWMVEQDEDAYTVVLNEGALDSIKVWQTGIPAMAVYGSSISPSQIRILRRLGVRKVILFFDNDAAGIKASMGALGVKIHTEKSRKTGKSFDTWEYDPLTDLTRDFLVEIVVYEDGVPDDPGAMSSVQIADAVEAAIPFSMQSIRHKLPKIRRRR